MIVMSLSWAFVYQHPHTICNELVPMHGTYSRKQCLRCTCHSTGATHLYSRALILSGSYSRAQELLTEMGATYIFRDNNKLGEFMQSLGQASDRLREGRSEGRVGPASGIRFDERQHSRRGLVAPPVPRAISYAMRTQTLLAGGASARGVTNVHMRHEHQR